MKTGKALRNRWLTRQGSEFQGRLSTASLDVDTSHHLLFIHLKILTLYIPATSQLNTADVNKLHAFRDLRSSLVASSLHILNLPLFLAQQAALSQTYILVSSHQQSVMAGNMSSVPNFFPLVLVSSLLAKLKLWVSHSGPDDSLWQLCYLCLLMAALIFCARETLGLPIACNDFKCSWQFGKEVCCWDAPLSHKRLPNNWFLHYLCELSWGLHLVGEEAPIDTQWQSLHSLSRCFS